MRRPVHVSRGSAALLALALGAIAGARGGAAPQERLAQGPRGPWLGQPAPGLLPEVFAPGLVSLPDRYEYVIAFSPDGAECCFGVTDRSWSTCDLWHARVVDGAWTVPAPALFQQGIDGWLPSYSPDGQRLYFSSGRPDQRDANSFVCERGADGWSAPRPLGAPVDSPATDWRPQETSDGAVWFCSARPGGVGDSDLWRCPRVEGGFGAPENLGPPVNSEHLEASPCVSADGRVLVFESWRPGGFGQADLYVSYRDDDGWSAPRNLGPDFNTERIEDGGWLSADGRWFFFNRREAWETDEPTDLLWVDARAVHAPYVRRPVGEAKATAGAPWRLALPAAQFADHDDVALALDVRARGGGARPAWLRFDPATRTLSGTPGRAGRLELEVVATDAVGGRCADPLTLLVEG